MSDTIMFLGLLVAIVTLITVVMLRWFDGDD